MTAPFGPTGPDGADLLSFATPYALHALSDADIVEIDRRLRDAPPDVVEAFLAEMRAVRETMAVIAAATAVEPPTRLRVELLGQIAARSRPPDTSRPAARKALVQGGAGRRGGRGDRPRRPGRRAHTATPGTGAVDC